MSLPLQAMEQLFATAPHPACNHPNNPNNFSYEKLTFRYNFVRTTDAPVAVTGTTVAASQTQQCAAIWSRNIARNTDATKRACASAPFA